MNKTALEHFQDIKELETADGPKTTVEDILPYKCEQVEKALECWEIVKNKPFILQKLFENKGLENQQEYDKKYFFGTITEEEVAKVKEGLK